MSGLVYRITTLLCQVLPRVPLGTNLGLLHLLFALMSGRFLAFRGAVFPALAALGLPNDAVRRSDAALAYGRFDSPGLLGRWQRVVRTEGQWQPVTHDGLRPVPCALTAFFRPHLCGLAGKHYQSGAGKALPALTLALAVRVGYVGRQRREAPSLVLPPQEGQSESALQQQAVEQAGRTLAADALIVDAGFPVADLLDAKVARFLARDAANATFRRNFLPAYKGKGRRAEWGEVVRPLSRRYGNRVIAATPPDATVTWAEGA